MLLLAYFNGKLNSKKIVGKMHIVLSPLGYHMYVSYQTDTKKHSLFGHQPLIAGHLIGEKH